MAIRFGEYLQKFFTNLKLDMGFLKTPRIKFADKLSYLKNKYRAILTNRRRIVYLGGNFEYDNRFVPAMLQDYPSEILHINEVIELDKIRSCLDIGANIGQFSYTLKKFFPKIQIYSFEPIKEVFQLLRKNLSRFDNVQAYNLAIGTKESWGEIYFSPEASAEGSFFKENLNQNYVRKNIKKVRVKTVNLSEKSLKKLKLPNEFDMVKIDVEGAEMDVIRAIKNLKFKYLYVEVSTSRRRGSSLEEIRKLLNDELHMVAELVYYYLPEKSSPAANALFKIK